MSSTQRIHAWFTARARELAQRSSRRDFLTRLGALLVGGAALPLLPVARSARAASATPTGEPSPDTPEGDPESCQYWRYCSIDGFLASCCGGTHRSCPPGTEMSPVAWIGTCRNPVDGRHYIVSYNDCCGKNACGRCFCNRNEGDRPIYYPHRSNDINWCAGTPTNVYHCSTAIVIGVAAEAQPER